MMKAATDFCPAIIVMAKAPRAGEAKTRLQPALTGEQAAALAACFLQDTIAGVGKITENLILAYAPADGLAVLEDLLPDKKMLWVEQRGANLSEKLEAAITHAENLGFNPIIAIGADSPTLPNEFVRRAIESLRAKRADAVLGATADGGFYLIGLQKNVPGVFDRIAWSTSAVYEQTRENLKKTGFTKLYELPPWFDVDTPHDLERLRREMLADKAAQLRAPQTFRWLLGHSFLFDEEEKSEKVKK